MRHVRLSVAVCILSTTSYAADWRMYLGDLSHASFQAQETQIQTGNVSQLQPLWRTSLGSPIAVGVTADEGSLYVGDWSGKFNSLNAATGAVVWSQFLGKAPDPADSSCMPGIGVSAQPVVAGDRVYAGGGDSAVYAMNKRTGEILWRVSLADPQQGAYLWSSLVLSQNSLYIGIASLTDCPLVRGGLARIPLDDPAHPQIRYLTPEGTQGVSIWSTPAIDEANGLIYVTTGNGSSQDAANGVWGSALLALDATSLAIRAHFFLPITAEEGDADWGSSPMLFESGGQTLVAANGKNGIMYVLERPHLQLVWTYPLAIDCDSPTFGCGSISTPAFDGNTLVTGAGQPDRDDAPPGAVYGFDPIGHNLLWQYAARAAVLAPVALTPGLVFAASLKGLAILDSTTGAELWNDGGQIGLFGQPVVSNGVLYATYTNGDVVAWGLPGDAGSFRSASPAGSLNRRD